MIIYGSRMYFKKNVVKCYGDCEFCGTYGKLVSYQARKFGHLYFIPLIPMGPAVQVLRECKRCNLGMHLEKFQHEGVVKSLGDQFKSCIAAIADGNRELPPAPGEDALNVGAVMAGSLPDLYCLGEIENVDSVVTLLDANGFGMEKELVLGQWEELQGNLPAAISHYESSHRSNPKSVYPLYNLGLAQLKNKDIRSAEQTFEQYFRLEPNDVTVYVELATYYEDKKNYPKIVENYEKIYELVPDVISDKRMGKIYKKACKKSGLQGKFLDQM